jgi:hypothetical protein
LARNAKKEAKISGERMKKPRQELKLFVITLHNLI